MQKRFMKGKKLAVLAAVVTISISIFYLSFTRLKPAHADNGLLLSLIMGGIREVHYSPQQVDDGFSEKIFSEYLGRVDYNKKIFTQKDIELLNGYKHLIDNEISDSSFEFFNAVMKIYSKRIEQAERYSRAPLEKPFDFSSEENIETDRDKLSYPADTLELKDAWRKYMKLQVLQQLYDKDEQQQKAKEKSDTVTIKSFAALEAAARTTVKKNNDDFFDRIHDLETNDWMAAYLNTISNVEDPHTEYFPPVQKQNFDIQMSGQLEGIGAQLQQRDGEIKITNIVPGSASWKQGQLKAGDVILKVAQGNQEPVSVEGMRLDKAIQLIRGKKGTEVRLTVKKPDGTVIVVPLIRDIVVIEATYAQSAVINSNGKKIGYIRLPEFYAPMDQKGGRGCASDVRKELLKLKAENVSGIILDLRDNGGGSLQEAVELCGLFISSGPVVQVRPRDARPNVLYDNDPDVIYNGPLTVMVNQNSASASEILAAAMQDYKRAVIIGSSSTYGKGTVQNFYNLDNFVSRSESSVPTFGSIKITIQKFYRVNGGSTQLKGVTPDIILPDVYGEIPGGEKEDKYAIKWDEINAVSYVPWTTNYDLSTLKASSEKRVNANPAFKLIGEEAMDIKFRTDHSVIPLNYSKYTAQQNDWDIKEKKYDAISADSMLVSVDNLSADLTRINADSTAIARNTQFLKNLRKDVYLGETVQVIQEMK
jgi:carboxyl-terminal processing protease